MSTSPQKPSPPPVEAVAGGFMEVLAVLGQVSQDVEVLEAASAIAPPGRRWRAVLPVPLPQRVPCRWGEAPERALALDYQARREDAEAHRAMMCRTLLRLRADADCEVTECANARLEDNVLSQARRAGLIVAGMPSALNGQMPMTARWFTSLLTHGGRPALVLPDHATLAQAPRQALVAWSDTPQASRALHEALQWLPTACTLRLVMAIGAGDSRGDCESAAGAAALLAHVQRHGRTATFEMIDAHGRPPEDVLLEAAHAMAADLVVMGAYGHAHALEFVFGGTTLNLLHRSQVPLFVAH